MPERFTECVSVEGRHLAHSRWAIKNCVSELHLPHNINNTLFFTDHVLNTMLNFTVLSKSFRTEFF